MTALSTPSTPATVRRFWIVNAIVSALALAVLSYVLLIRGGEAGGSDALSFMPAVDATFNGISATLLVLAVRAIRRKQVRRHQALVIGAFVSSLLFLAGYLAYHYVHGDTRYAGTGVARTLYLVMLASHILLSIPVVPLCLAAFYFALTGRFETHKRITRFLFPIWLYVSVTGVLVFFVLRSSY